MLIIYQVLIHIGVNIRLLPTTGMTLPFLSYGGSSLLSCSILAGLILNFTKKEKFKFMKKISISTGGTGGHVIPAQVLYDYLSDKYDVIITSDNRGLNYLDKNVYKTKKIDVPKITKNILDFVPFLIFLYFPL